MFSRFQHHRYNSAELADTSMPGNRNSETMAMPSTYDAPGIEVAAVELDASDGGDDKYSYLADYDTVLLVDDSGSMAGSRWTETANALAVLVDVVTRYDTDGVDIHFLNAVGESRSNMRQPTEVMNLFRSIKPRGRTPIGGALKRILMPYFEAFSRDRRNCKPLNIIIVTDGEPTDDPDSVIEQCAKALDFLEADPRQIGIQFVQVGNDPAATHYLKYLDDNLHEICKTRDMVDTIPWTGNSGNDWLLKATLGAITRRYDHVTLPMNNGSAM